MSDDFYIHNRFPNNINKDSIKTGGKVLVKGTRRVGVLKKFLVVEIEGEDKLVKYEDIRRITPKLYIYGVHDYTGAINVIVFAKSKKEAKEITQEYVKKNDKVNSNIVIKVCERLGVTTKYFTRGEVISYNNDYLIKDNHDLNNKTLKIYKFDLSSRKSGEDCCLIACASCEEEAINISQEYIENNNKFMWRENYEHCKWIDLSIREPIMIGTTNKFSKAQVMVCKDIKGIFDFNPYTSMCFRQKRIA